MIHTENFRERAQSVRQSTRAHLLDIRRARLAKRGHRAEKQSMVLQDDYSPPADAPATTVTAPGDRADMPEILPPPESIARYDDLDQVALTNLMVAAAVVPRLPAQPAAQIPDADYDPISKPADIQVAAPPTPLPGHFASTEDAEDKAVRAVALVDLTKPYGAVDTAAGSPQFVPITAEPNGSMSENLPAEAEGALPADQEATIVLPEPEAEIGPVAPTVRPCDPLFFTCDTDLNSLPGAGPGLVWMLRQCGVYSLQDLASTEASVLIPKLGLVGQILNIEPWLDFARAQRTVL